MKKITLKTPLTLLACILAAALAIGATQAISANIKEQHYHLAIALALVATA